MELENGLPQQAFAQREKTVRDDRVDVNIKGAIKTILAERRMR